MRKALLSTTALVAAGLLVTSVAYADEHEEMAEPVEPISVSLGGYYHSALIVVANDEDNDRGHGFQQDIELEVAGETTLDNGITVGVRVRIEGDRSFTRVGDSNTDESEVSLSAGFGRIAYGNVEGAAQLGTIWSPGNAFGGVKSAWFGSSVPGWTTGAMGEDSLKLSYYSPAFNGVSFGVSYAPEDTVSTRPGRLNDEAGEYGEGIQSALNYAVDVMGGSFGANVGYETYASEDGGDDATATRFGASLSIDQITVAGAVQTRSAISAAGDQTISDVGVGWSQGPLSLHVSYGSHENDTGANTVINGAGAGYNLGPGIDFAAQFNMVESGSDESTEVLLGTFISF